MSFPKLLAIFATILFSIIGIAAIFKGSSSTVTPIEIIAVAPVEIELAREIQVIPPRKTVIIPAVANPEVLISSDHGNEALPDADRIEELFNVTAPQLPIVQTITYKSHVAWQKGRPAWLSDYASHYTTSRHFIARSLNRKVDYLKQDIAEGDRFNVLHPDKKINFYLLIDTSRNKLWFYYLDQDTNERVLLKTYTVGLGRIDSSKPSGMLTPLGKYSLGNKIAIYKPKTMGLHHGQKIEMIQVFGSRWLPFDKELGECTAPAAGFGIHGVPWGMNSKGELIEETSSLGKNESDGCIRLSTKDIEELFAIIITRPTTVELVKNFYDTKLPGIER